MFTARGVEILAVGPDGPAAFRYYWRAQRLPFTGLPDPDHKVARLYRQEVKILKLGRLPMVIVIDGRGDIRYVHRGDSMADIPSNRQLLDLVDTIGKG